MKTQFDLRPEDARLIRTALMRHDCETLHPKLERDQARELKAALDKLRLALMEIAEPQNR